MNSFDNGLLQVICVLRNEYGLDGSIDVTSETSIAGLGIETDDWSFLIIPAIHKSFGRKLSVAEWAKIETIGDIVAAFENQRS